MNTATTTEGTAPGAHLRAALRADLRSATKARDRMAVAALRSALAALDNAEAVPLGEQPTAAALEASPVGVGVAEVARRVLGKGEVIAVVAAEIQERRSAADEVERFDPGRAEQLRREAEVLARHLP